MNIKQLEVFLSVIEEGSFSAGAKAVFITQSTASQHILALEEELGVKLFERSRNGITLTAAGELLQKHARQIIGDMGAATDAIARLRGVQKVSLKVAASTIPGDYLCPRIIAKVCNGEPNACVELIQGDSKESLVRVLAQEVELGVVGNRFEERGLLYEPIKGDEVKLVAQADHPWAKEGVIPLDKLVESQFIQRESGSGTGKTISSALKNAGLNPLNLKSRATLGSNEAVKSAIKSGLGVGFLSHFSVEGELARKELVEIPIKDFSITRPFYVVRRAGRDLSELGGRFYEAMLEQYPNKS